MNGTVDNIREKVMKYILTNYTEIFDLNDTQKDIVSANLAKIDNIQLEKEIKLLDTFFVSKKNIYQNALLQTTQSIERIEKDSVGVPTFSF